MKIRILGSGGGEGFPAPFCSCEHCETARKMGEKSLRSLSQSIINDDLLIDFPADTNAHCLRFGVNLGQLQNVLITHSHRDHYVPQLLSDRSGFAAHNLKYQDVYFYGPANLEQICDAVKIPEPIREHIQFVALEPQKTVSIGEYEITPLKALHSPELGSLNYIIEQGGKRVLYLVDSGYPTEETLAYLQSLGKIFDLVVMDGTFGFAPAKTYIYHMGYEENKLLKTELEQLGIADAHTRYVVTHITHNKSEYHEKVEEIFAGTGIEVAYDGFEVEI